jgi:hypothetical protein
MLSPADLPNDIDALKALLLASERLLQERDEQLAGLAEQLNTRAVEIEHLKLQIAKLRRMQFGRKSEKLYHQIAQLELQLEDLQADEAEAAREMPAADQAPRKKSVRRPLPDHLLCDDKVYAPTADACPACGGEGVLQADGRALRGGLRQRARSARSVPARRAQGIQQQHPVCRPLHGRARRSPARCRAGRPDRLWPAFIANPDLPGRIANGWPLSEVDPTTPYSGNEAGYTDYPAYAPCLAGLQRAWPPASHACE